MAHSVLNGRCPAGEFAHQCLDAIDRSSSLNVFTYVAREEAQLAADRIGLERTSSESLGPLAGVPIAIKDGICTRGMPTTSGSAMLSKFIPPYDATVVQRLKQAGAIIIGKTNMDEFAMGSSTEKSFFGPTKNPHDTDRVAGGSSGGSAACVAAGLCPVALGSDTGGSIRQPAAFCGVTGLKPTYGRVSRYGLIAYASSLDQIGPIARTAEDCALVMNVIAGHDPLDSTSARMETEDYTARLKQSIKGLRFGVCKEHFNEGLHPEIDSAIQSAIGTIRQLGGEIVELSMPHSKWAVPTYYLIASCEASSNLARYDGVRHTQRADGSDLEQMYSATRSRFFGTEVKRRIMLGTFALSSGYYDAYYLKASKVRRLIKQDYDQAFSKCDVILGPTTPTPPFRLGEHSSSPVEMYLADIYTVSANLAGVPAISIPIGWTADKLPIGMQLQGPMFSEAMLLQVAHQLEGFSKG